MNSTVPDTEKFNRVDYMLCVFYHQKKKKKAFISFEKQYFEHLNVPMSLLLQINIRVRELILLIMPFNHAGEIMELSKEANKLYIKSSQSVSL